MKNAASHGAIYNEKCYMLRIFGHSKKNVENKMKQTNEYSVDGREDKKF